jgi:glycosyltransferase involved in cell wall biosynthesis
MKESQIKKPYLLYVGNAYPHKNLKRLILAFKKLVEDYNLDYQLVLVGGGDHFYRKLRRDTNLRMLPQFTNRILFLGFVSDKELDELYKNASLYVFPSLHEGFGLPPLEAMARGLPVVSSSATCLPEILGKAIIYFNPLDIDDMAEKIKKTLLDNRAKKDLIRKGYKQIKKYSWRKMAEETLEIYKNIPQ